MIRTPVGLPKTYTLHYKEPTGKISIGFTVASEGKIVSFSVKKGSDERFEHFEPVKAAEILAQHPATLATIGRSEAGIETQTTLREVLLQDLIHHPRVITTQQPAIRKHNEKILEKFVESIMKTRMRK
jgi:hypothetical protein